MSKKGVIDRSVKYQMIVLAGTRCMCCGQDVGRDITWHHLKPRYAGGKDSLSNASLLCANCHTHIHKYKWGDAEYIRLTKIILKNREEFTERKDLHFSFDWEEFYFPLFLYFLKGRNKMNELIKSIFAGLCIGIAGTAYVALGGGPFAACLFTIGLISIVLFDFNLYTGKIGYIKSYKDIPRMLLILLGNLIGCWLVAVTSGVEANALVESKLIMPLYQVFFRGIWCGFLMYIAVDTYKQYKSLVGIFFGIPTFILCGFEHSIADLFYFFSTGTYTLQMWLFILTVVIGNAIGANLFKLLKLFEIKGEN